MTEIEHGESRRLHHGAVFAYRCLYPGSEIRGSALVFCDGQQWNDTKPACLGKRAVLKAFFAVQYFRYVFLF